MSIYDIGTTSQPSALPRIRIKSRAARAFLANPSASLGLALVGLVTVAAVLAPVLSPGDPLAMAGEPLLWPLQSADHPLGTDSMGRDVLAGVIHGARVSLFVGLSAAGLGLLIGLIVGAVAGFFGGKLENLLMRVTELFQILPSFVLVVVMVAILDASAGTVALSIALVTWPQIARLTRAEVRSLKSRDFVQAARSIGYSNSHIILREILPNALPPIIVTASVMVASAILMESALSFMGLGDPETVSWGMMIANGREMIRTAWFLTALPGVAIVLTVLALNLIGDGLNDALNPRALKRS